MTDGVDQGQHDPVLSFIVLNYRNPKLTRKCHDFATRSMALTNIEYEFIIVDNSADATSKELLGLFPEDVTIIFNDENVGFARACNVGIARSRGQFIVLLNNDAFINAECVRAGLLFLQGNTNAGVWAPRLLNSDGTLQNSIGLEPTLRTLSSEYLGIFRIEAYPGSDSWTEPTEVETVTGAFMMIPRRVLETAGLLDEDFFFTSEDVEFCSRVRARSFSVWYDPSVSIIHAGGASQAWKWLNDPYLHRFRLLFFRKRRGAFHAILAFFIIKGGLAKRRTKLRLKRLLCP